MVITGSLMYLMVETGHVHWLGRRTPNRQTVRAMRRGRSDLFKGVSIKNYRVILCPSMHYYSLHKGSLRCSYSSMREWSKQRSNSSRYRSILKNEHTLDSDETDADDEEDAFGCLKFNNSQFRSQLRSQRDSDRDANDPENLSLIHI